jgi:hypothetical protein
MIVLGIGLVWEIAKAEIKKKLGLSDTTSP